jgi:hypothetical protein
MHSVAASANVRACDPVAAAVEERIHKMQSAGYGELVISKEIDGVCLTFGKCKARGETYEIGLLRLAGAMLDDAVIGNLFMERIRSVQITDH